jgi:hypothetical protein
MVTKQINPLQKSIFQIAQQVLRNAASAPEVLRPHELMQIAEELQLSDICQGKTSTLAAGTVTGQEENQKWRLQTQHGLEVDLRQNLDEQPSTDCQSNPSATATEIVPNSDSRPASVRALDEGLAVEFRLDALRELMANDSVAAASFVYTELEKPILSEQWRRIVIYAAESVRFADPAVRAKVAVSLLRHACELRVSSSADDTPVVMCAIRRAGSILPQHLLTELSCFLSAPSPIDTRIVTLQAINSIILAAPLEGIDIGTLGNRVTTLALKHWDEDVFKAGEISVIAIEATIAATVLGDARMSQVIELANRTGRRLLIGKLKSRLQAVVTQWGNQPSAAARVNDVISLL